MTAQADSPRPAAGSDRLSRREFLNYAWLASLGILVLESGFVLYRFAVPGSWSAATGAEVELGPVDGLPGPGQAPQPFAESRFWWVATDQGALALSAICPHLGCIFEWAAVEGRFVCPCHGSQFARSGAWLTGPSPRGLDRLVIRAVDGAGNELGRTNEAGDPLMVPAGAIVVVTIDEPIAGPAKA